jgi:hypothetical protein
MGDVTAVVLSIGEATTARALESARRQAPEEIIVIRGVTPFHKAFNAGASRVKTEFFVQVDSDMILDENCFRDLRKCMEDDVGLVLGHLRDPLIDRVGWIKMFRRKCFEAVQYNDSISTDVVFADEIARAGWKTVFALRPLRGAPKELWHTFGEHRPSYAPLYTYSKYMMEGRKYRYRKALGALLWHFKLLEKSRHPSAFVAQIGLAHGLFIREDTDLLKPYEENPDFEFLERFLTGTGARKLGRFRVLPTFTFSTKKAFRDKYRLGISLRRAGAFPAFKRCMDLLDRSQDPLARIAKIGLCHGIFFEAYDEPTWKAEHQVLRELLAEYRLLGILRGKAACFIYAAGDLIVEWAAAIGAGRLLKKIPVL